LPFYEYDPKYANYKGKLDYTIFDNLDYLILEINNLKNQASSDAIIEYCSTKNIKIIKKFLINFPIYPINWSGYGENKTDYIKFTGLDNIDYKKRFYDCITSCKNSNLKSDLSMDLTTFIENNFHKQLIFTHSLHPTNILLHELWRNIFSILTINIDDYNYTFDKQLIDYWHNPFTTKMVKDLNIEFETIIDDNFYIDRYTTNVKNILSTADTTLRIKLFSLQL